MNYRKEIRKIQVNLEAEYPKHPLGRHIAIAFEEEDLFNISDKHFYNVLQKYQNELDLGGRISETFTEDIINDGMHLFDTLEKEENDNDY